MLNYRIENYEYDILPQDNWNEYLFNTIMCGVVTNKDDKNIGIPIVVDKESLKLGPLPYPHFMCKSTKEFFNNVGRKICPWIIKCDINDVIELLRENDNYVVALYHEIGHFHYSDEQDQSASGDEYRLQQLMLGKVSNEEIQADSFAARALGRERVIKALKATLNLFMMNPSVYTSDIGKLSIKEFQLRIAELKKEN